MDVMLVITVDESQVPADPDPETAAAMMAGWERFNQLLVGRGAWLAGASLQPSARTRTVRLGAPGSGPVSVTDGPYAETAEQVGGFYLVSVTDLEEAVDLAGQMPAPYAVVEVRPVAFRPDI